MPTFWYSLFLIIKLKTLYDKKMQLEINGDFCHNIHKNYDYLLIFKFDKGFFDKMSKRIVSSKRKL